MTWSTFLGGFHSAALRDLPIAYTLVLLMQGGYFAWILRRWTGRERGN